MFTRVNIVFSFALLAAAASACGSDDASTGGSAGAGNAAGSGNAAGAPDTGSCRPSGAWALSYDGGMCSPSDDTLRVAVNADGSASVEFVGLGPEPDECSPDGGLGTYSESGEVSIDGCTLTARRSSNVCRSGEQQCAVVEFTLSIVGDTASGTGTACRCWCPSPGCNDEPIEVTASRIFR